MGMMRSGSVSELPISELRTDATESSSSRGDDPRSAAARTLPMWATPDAAVMNDGQSVEAFSARKERERAKGYNGNGGGTTLAMQARLDWPTPQARDAKGPLSNHSKSGRDLSSDASAWPTPTAGDMKNSGSRTTNPSSKARPGTTLTDATMRQSASGKMLSADWVETLQGFPADYTRVATLRFAAGRPDQENRSTRGNRRDSSGKARTRTAESASKRSATR